MEVKVVSQNLTLACLNWLPQAYYSGVAAMNLPNYGNEKDKTTCDLC